MVDYRSLHKITKWNKAPIPRADEMLDQCGDAMVFPKFDLIRGFHQIRKNTEHVWKTDFNTSYGRFEYLLSPTRALNPPVTFLALVNQMFRDCINKFVMVYIDYLLVFIKYLESYDKHMKIFRNVFMKVDYTSLRKIGNF